jgi:hypothetical protein
MSRRQGKTSCESVAIVNQPASFRHESFVSLACIVLHVSEPRDEPEGHSSRELGT